MTTEADPMGAAHRGPVPAGLPENPTISGSVAPAFALALLVCALSTSALQAQARRFEPIIEPRPAAAVEGEIVAPAAAPALPTAAECEAAARRIADAFEPNQLREWLHRQFPNREEFLDAFHRAALAASNLELWVESVERVRIGDWRRVRSGAGVEQLAADCTVYIRTRLVFDDPDTGERVVRRPGRAQWRIRFETAPSSEEVAR